MAPDMLTREMFTGYQLEIFASVKPGYAGTAILVRNELQPTNIKQGIGIKEFDAEGRVIAVQFGKFEVVSVYAPHSHRELINLEKKKRFIKAFNHYVASKISEDSGRTVILAGDFNVAFEERDLFHSSPNKGNAGFHNDERELFSELLKIGFVDALREVNQDTGVFSWWSLLPGVKDKNIGWRLDYLLVPELAKQRVLECFHSPEAEGSDHCPVTLDLVD